MDLGFATSPSCYQSKFKKCEQLCFRLTAPPLQPFILSSPSLCFLSVFKLQRPGTAEGGRVKGLFGWASPLVSRDTPKGAWIWLWGQREDTRNEVRLGQAPWDAGQLCAARRVTGFGPGRLPSYPTGSAPSMLHSPETSLSPRRLSLFGRDWSRPCHPHHQRCARPTQVTNKSLQVGCQVPGVQPPSSQGRGELRQIRGDIVEPQVRDSADGRRAFGCFRLQPREGAIDLRGKGGVGEGPVWGKFVAGSLQTMYRERPRHANSDGLGPRASRAPPRPPGRAHTRTHTFSWFSHLGFLRTGPLMALLLNGLTL